MKNNKTILSLALSIAAVTPLASMANEHQNEIEALKERIKALEEKAVTSTDKGGFKISNTTFNFGGYIKGDVLYTNNGVNGTNAFISVRSAQSADDDAEDRVDLSARESRFYVKTTTPIAGKPFKTHLEFDFYGGAAANEFVSNSFSPRLRHAYGSWGNLLVGQTWSTFMDTSHLAELNAFGQHASTIFVRQSQIRYTLPFNGGSAMLAIENPEDSDDDQKTPDLVARVNLDNQLGHFSAGILFRELADGDDTRSASAYSITAKIPTFGKDDIRVQYNSGDLGRYMGLRTYPDTDPAASSLDAFESSGGSFAYRHFWTPSLRSTVMYSKTEADSEPSGTIIESSESIHINLMWSANPKLRYGIEFAQWEVESAGETQELDVVQLSARYSF